MNSVERSVVVEQPVKRVYEVWQQVENFPKFMKAIREVRRLDEKRFAWTAEYEGRVFESEAEITLEIPESRIAWRTISGAENSGVVSFESSDASTLVCMKVKYEPDDALQDPVTLGTRLEEDLNAFKRFMESGSD